MIFRQFIFESMKRDPRFGTVYSRVAGRPTWTWKYAAMAAGIVVVVPIVLLILAGLFTFVVVFTVLNLANRLGLFFRSLGPKPKATTVDWPRDPGGGRKNVRVVGADFRPNE